MTALKGKGKAAVKTGMQCGKLITESRFYKPPKWKRKTSFRAIASVARESAVCLHRSFATEKWVDGFLDGTNLQIDRGVTRLGGARGKMQVWRPRFEPEVFRKQMYCVEECTCDIVGIFWLPGNHSTPRSISAPREWFGAWVFAPPFPFVTPLLIEP